MWSPHLVKDIILIESIQRKFTKRIPGLHDLTYADRLAHLKITTLERRRLVFDLTLCFKILHGLVSGPPEKYGFVLSDRISRGHSLKLSVEHSKVDVREYFFCNRVCKPWNSFPDKIVSDSNLNKFKTWLKTAKLDEFFVINPFNDNHAHI